ncbi:protein CHLORORESPIRATORY REDUCTION 7, chloroplastic isoform X2 [Oryza brachyantha]|uniref:protein CHLORORESPIRATORY REDUCTION 7, chloroplastic isoform X2 n=1 Tax=Oryza brachyantha TaxID=4533 RepID=UPI0003EAB135|nr:protein CHLORORESPIRATORY REDUCTION 7, chloroplastic isoform X2 [Oryza brachyantha]
MEAAMAASTGELFTGKSSVLLPHQRRWQQHTFTAAAAAAFAGSRRRVAGHHTMIQHQQGSRTEVGAARRRRADIRSETYVLMEPGEEEEFVSKEELEDRLRAWLERWPGGELPPDLARFDTVDDAVSYLVRSVCELEIDGEVGSVQWYQVQLE